jgi:hypothetical protein
MPVSTLREARTLTAAELATFALQEDQERRRAERRGDMARAAELESEVERLCRLSQEAGRK